MWIYYILGENCDEPVKARIVGPSETEKSSTGAFAGMFVAILLLAIIIMLFLYYRKRVATLKTVIAHVQYGADPHSINPGKYFDAEVKKEVTTKHLGVGQWKANSCRGI